MTPIPGRHMDQLELAGDILAALAAKRLLNAPMENYVGAAEQREADIHLANAIGFASI